MIYSAYQSSFNYVILLCHFEYINRWKTSNLDSCVAWVSTDELLCASLTICPPYLQTSVSGTLRRHLKRAPQSSRMPVSVRVYAIVCQPLSASTSLHCDWILQVPFVEDHLRLLQERRRCTLKQLCVRAHVCVLKHSLCTCAVVTAGVTCVCVS